MIGRIHSYRLLDPPLVKAWLCRTVIGRSCRTITDDETWHERVALVELQLTRLCGLFTVDRVTGDPVSTCQSAVSLDAVAASTCSPECVTSSPVSGELYTALTDAHLHTYLIVTS